VQGRNNKVLVEKCGCPSVMFDGDHMHGDRFSFAQFQTRIDAFMEMLLEKKNL
jgi:benzoyl-CoA reductase/2-hydroxyglutaryl-CoA dehydratase subunit BcrC/BadD/HgdB